MEFTFYDSNGKPIAYTQDGVHIYLFSGEPVAYLAGTSVYSFSGKHLGRFENGWIRDNNGECVFFTKDARGGPLKPLKQLKPLKSLKQLKPLKGLKELKPLRPLKSLSWSRLSGKQFFRS
jgi:hypothetical protein